MSAGYRYPGARPFESQETTVFFGREEDIKLLLQQIQLKPLLVLYGKSGLGKSSLLNAGLVPRVQNEQHLDPFFIRFHAYQQGAKDNVLPLDRVRNILEASSSLLDQFCEEMPKSIWYLVKAHQLNAENDQGVLLVFDQFEELFTYPTEAVVAFSNQLSTLLSTTIPDLYRWGLERRLKESENSVTEENLQRLHRPIRLRVIMAIRSDRYSLLDRLKTFLPSLMDNTYELKPLSSRQAEDAILNPAYESNGFISTMFDFDDDAVDHLIHFLSQDQEQHIESFQLQILCEYIERKLVIEQGKKLIHKTDLAEPQKILEDYYMNKIIEIEDPEDQLAVRWLIEEGLIFEEEERRLSLYEGQIERSYGVGKALLDRLVATHLIRAEPSLRGGYTYELSHDTLVIPVLKAKSLRVRAEEEDHKKEAERKRQAELAEERHKRRRALHLALVMAVLALLFMVASVLAYSQYREASDAKADAQQKQQEAEENLRQRIELEIQNLLREVDILEKAGQFTLARQKLQDGLTLDPANIILQNKLNSLKEN